MVEQDQTDKLCEEPIPPLLALKTEEESCEPRDVGGL